jgi:ApbE superfamily uncharacterized protein (UPF0280 family)
MTRLPQIAMLADGRRLHLQDGPIDLIVEAWGSGANVRAAYDAAARRLTGLLDALCEELPELRKAADPANYKLDGKVARRMHAYVNNGGDIALHLGEGEHFTVGLVDMPDQPGLMRTTVIGADDVARGIATSGRHGRSFSLGIADAVTVLARTASQADAAATIIANAVDLPGHPAVLRCPAHDLQPDSDLGARLVTREVGHLSYYEIEKALQAGADKARALLAGELIESAALRLHGETHIVAAKTMSAAVQRRSIRESVMS